MKFNLKSLMFVVAFMVPLGLGACTTGPNSDNQVDWRALPTDPAQLAALNDQQEQLLRREADICNVPDAPDLENNACVLPALDNYIRQYGSPALKAFHFGMIPPDRYNQFRTPDYVTRLLQRRADALAGK